MRLARGPCPVTYNVCNDLLEHQFDTETQLRVEVATIERVAQRGETTFEAPQRPGKADPARVRVDAPFLKARRSSGSG
jgi:hypothetical protein